VSSLEEFVGKDIIVRLAGLITNTILQKTNILIFPMSFLWSYVKRNKWKSTLGITASTGALLYTFREPIMEIVKPVTERLLAYAMEQQMNAMKIQGRVEARNTHFKQIGSQTFTNIGDFFPTIINRFLN
jgi:hypothetical protein